MGWYVETTPPPDLRAFVECLWVHAIDDPPPPEGRRLLPSGHVDFVWIAGLGMRVAGPQTRYTLPPDLGRMLAVGVRFHAGAAPMLLRAPASSLVDTHVALDALAPRLAARIDDRLLEAPSTDALAEELRRGLRHVEDPDARVLEAV